MLFNSFEFIFIFFPIFIFLYYNKTITCSTGSIYFLVITFSLFFYSYNNLFFLFLILGSISFNYFCIIKMIDFKENFQIKKKIFIFALFNNILILILFKYTNFLVLNYNLIFSSNHQLFNLVFPLGLSFYTLQQITILFDAYEGKIKSLKILKYASFVTFFPQLIAGPILTYDQFYKKIGNRKNHNIKIENFYVGIFIFIIGLSKKILIADSLGKYSVIGFQSFFEQMSFFDAWLTSLSFTLQIYFDFSGYSDMAVGLALILNIKFINNFNSPYKSTSIIDFWHRWHISLSNFINIYIFSNIIKSFKNINNYSLCISLTLTMIIAGIWHGPTWGYVAFGLIHGLALSINHLWRNNIKAKLPPILAWFVTFNIVNISLVFFRSENLSVSLKILEGMYNFNYLYISIKKILLNLNSFDQIFDQNDKIFGEIYSNLDFIYCSLLILISGILIFFFKNSSQFNIKDLNTKKLFFLSICLFFDLCLLNNKIFLYFGF